MKFTAAGDILIQRRMQKYEDFDKVKSFVEKGDARFFNLETTLNYEGECSASALSGGTYLRANPEVLDDIKDMGFNLMSFNNNHMMDFGTEGLLKTIEYADKSGLIHAGVGRNLDEASAPKYLETDNGRVAIVSVITYFDAYMMAGKQTGRIKGRPGVNGIRNKQIVHLEKEDFEAIKRIAEKTGINAENETDRKEGYLLPLPENEAEFGAIKISCDTKSGIETVMNTNDLERLKKSLEEASFAADYVILSVHTHELEGGDKAAVPKFIEELCRFAVDNGANAVIGHGPHLLRAIEIYKNSPIFYSLGDFFLELYSMEFAPNEFYEKFGLTAENTVYELLKKRSHNFKLGLMEDRKMRVTVIPYWETEGKKLTKMELLPIECKVGGNKSQEGLPYIAENLDFIEELARLSKPYGTDIEIADGKIIVKGKGM